MRINKTMLFALVSGLIITGIYIFDYKAAEKNLADQQALILNQDLAQINYLQIIKPDLKISLQKNETGWRLLEPLQDAADSNNIEDLLGKLVKERQISVVMQSENVFSNEDLQEFGLDKPALEINFKNNIKNNTGATKKVSVGSVKNYEGYSYLRIDSENKIILANPVWHEASKNELIYYREKKLYRSSLANIVKMKVRSVRDEFELKLIDGKWLHSSTTGSNTGSNTGMVLDQNKVREVLKKISGINILQYVFEGKPSAALVKKKGLHEKQVYLNLYTKNTRWSATLSLNTEDKALYALTESPSFIVKIDIPAWETIGNLKLAELRELSSAAKDKLNTKSIEKPEAEVK